MLIVCTYSAPVHVISAYQDGSIDASDAASDQISSFRTRYGGDYRRAADRVGRMMEGNLWASDGLWNLWNPRTSRCTYGSTPRWTKPDPTP